MEPGMKATIRKAAQASGVSVNEYVCDALQSRVRQETEWRGGENFTPHGGKHKFGKSTGYEVTKDGRYYPAPCWNDRFAHLFAERLAIHNLVNGIVKTAQERLIAVEQQIVQAKNDLVADLGLDPAKDWVYRGGSEGHLYEQKPEDNE